ncbi:hypothetical protein NDA11_004922 [Ustilago hordei]|uniref:PHD-type domain-containing protein n=1 Tax=Ustilago hordei TaxID=120017 RepID=I2G3A0_USTHO|nr:uncharacterized protein UHO2_02956 [Ustilago hordei]KAJ1038179.1 hypothetical protein NDA10_002566 [Ustilago hordei]KAJ1584850.1 hypothetical protein NDA15_000101 [Ustilago hordei]KAJ1588054.1 hypothetical protein NDA12_003342 [Ustilago hordei]KAJ1593108.1 hypothetical protein NDA11_004922 [Ustilago hordei]CCF53643.1 uncharacterized protein UHOR_02225 [Ustilago hordei]
MSNQSSKAPAGEQAAVALAPSRSESEPIATQQAFTKHAEPVVKVEPLAEPLLPAETLQLVAVDEPISTVTAAPLAARLIGSASSNTAPELTSTSDAASTAAATNFAAPASAATPAPNTIAALSAPTSSSSARPEGDALRTEIMGPPPSLPADPAYPPLNPVLTDMPAPVPNPKRRAPTTAANGTSSKTTSLQAPDDFVPPTNLNGKMPYALFQTVKKAFAPGSKSPADPHASQSTSTLIDAATAADNTRAPSTEALSSAAAAAAENNNIDTNTGNNSSSSNVVDPLITDVLTDADSVATATATRETSPGSSIAPEPIQSVTTEEVAPAQQTATSPATSQSLATPSKVISTDAVGSPSTPAATISEVPNDASPSVALRRNPSSRGASMQASQSITSSYADPLGLKKHRETQLQDEARSRRSPSASSIGGTPSATAATAAGSKRSNAARTIVPPNLVEPPPGMMHTPEGRLRTIPGIAGAHVPPGPNSTSTDTNLTPRLEDKESANNDFCETCGGHGRFVCCDGCPRSFHFFCMNPPLDIDEMPPSNAAQVLGPAKEKGKGKAGPHGSQPDLNMDEMWFCNVCVAERKPKAVTKPKGLGPFGCLLSVLSQHNPKSFQLPADVRTYFKDVATANDGDYVNGAMIRPIKPNKHGLIEARDPYRLKDKNGDAVLCYRCGGTALPFESEQPGIAGSKSRKGAKSALVDDVTTAALPADHTIREGTGWRKIVSCDFCSLHWHIDCVDPPMLGMPSNRRKWMCPAHSDHVNDRRRVARMGTAVPRTFDLPLPSAKTIGPGKHFRTRVLNNGDIDIIPDTTEGLMGANGITGSLQSGIKEIAVVPGVVDLPSLTAGGSKLASKIRYRFPEKVIRTDFWSKLKADDANSIGTVFYVAAAEVAGRSPIRLVAAEDEAKPGHEDGLTRYRPFGRRDYPRSGLDSLADIAAARLAGDEAAKKQDSSLIQPSKTRQLVMTALGIDLQNEDVPESSVRSSLEDEDETSPDSPLSSLSDSEVEAENGAAPATGPAAAPVAVPQDAPAPPTAHSPAATGPALSEEELIKRIAAQASQGVSSGSPIRLSKRKAAVAAESALSTTPVNKKLRSASPAVTPSPATRVLPPSAATPTVSVEIRPAPAGKKITLKTNGKEKQAEEMMEAKTAMRMAYHLSEQYADERKEIEQLRAIRELMRLKGPDRLLEFLLAPNDNEQAEGGKSA